jgi:tripartite-type tricarboxylate transporter receptor subunit TctC
MTTMRLGAARLFCIALSAAFVGEVFAQASYPTRPVRVVVPSSPGGGTDILTRLMTPGLSEKLGQQVIVDNRPGAGSIIGNEFVAKAPPDGYTLLMAIATLVILPSTHSKLGYDAHKDLAPVTLAIAAPNIITAHPSLPVKSIRELIAFARKRPGELNYASPGQGSNPHLTMALFLSMAKLDMVHVPYKGSGPALIDVLAGHIELFPATMLSGLAHVRSGRLRGLATTGATRSSALPDLPTVAESGMPGFEAVQWYGLLAPAGTPSTIIAQLHEAMVSVLDSPSLRKRLAADGVEIVANTPQEFRDVMRADAKRWAQAVRAAGLQPR